MKLFEQSKTVSSHYQFFVPPPQKKKNYGPFLCLKARATARRRFTFYHLVSRNSWYSSYPPRKDERLSGAWSHPMVLNTGPLDQESSALTKELHLICCMELELNIVKSSMKILKGIGVIPHDPYDRVQPWENMKT